MSRSTHAETPSPVAVLSSRIDASRKALQRPERREPLVARKAIDLARHDEIGLGELASEDVGDVLRHAGSGHLLEAGRLDEHREGGEPEAARVEPAQRPVDRGDEIGTAADSLSEQDVHRPLREQPVRFGDEVVEAAAEAAARDLRRRQAEAAEDRGVDEVLALVVRDDATLRPRATSSRAAAARPVVFPAPRNPETQPNRTGSGMLPPLGRHGTPFDGVGRRNARPDRA